MLQIRQLHILPSGMDQQNTLFQEHPEDKLKGNRKIQCLAQFPVVIQSILIHLPTVWLKKVLKHQETSIKTKATDNNCLISYARNLICKERLPPASELNRIK